jgi:hypothetical protein
MRRTVSLLLLCGLVACADAREATPAPEATETAAAELASELAQDDARLVIRSGRLELRTADLEEVSNALGGIASDFGGYIETSDGSGGGEAFERYEATLRVPGERFENAMAELRTHGDVLREHVDSTDVTEQYSDVGAELRSHRTLEARLLALLETAQSIEDALRVETELVRVRTAIETLEGRRAVMERQVAMATIAVVLVHPEAPDAPDAQSAIGRIRNATHDARELSVSAIVGMIRVFGAIFPLLLVGGVIAFAAHRGRRRWHAKNPPKA